MEDRQFCTDKIVRTATTTLAGEAGRTVGLMKEIFDQIISDQ